MTFNTSLLREKFLITEQSTNKQTKTIEAVSNRIVLPLSHGSHLSQENFVVRGKAMHCVTRMAAAMAQEFEEQGPLLHRLNDNGWANLWQGSQNSFDRAEFPDNWIAVFQDGNPIFTIGAVHPFLTVMEQCDARNRAEYDRAVRIAEDIFKQAGKIVSIDHETTIAMVTGLVRDMGRSGLVMRVPKHTSTFTFHMTGLPSEDGLPDTESKKVTAHHLLDMSADYMEALHLSVNIGLRQFQEFDVDLEHLKRARKRLGQVNQNIQGFENLFQFRYRPEKPDFLLLIKQIEDSL